jgi:hypothetical protein
VNFFVLDRDQYFDNFSNLGQIFKEILIAYFTLMGLVKALDGNAAPVKKALFAALKEPKHQAFAQSVRSVARSEPRSAQSRAAQQHPGR